MSCCETQNLAVGYGAPLLRDIALHAERGKILALIGPNGAGDTQKHRRGQLALHFRLAGNGFDSLTGRVAFADTRADTGNQSQTSADRAAHEYDCSF